MKSTGETKFAEITVEKLNIVDSNGKVKMMLFNQENIPPLILDGEDVLPGHRQTDPISGIMFYNGEEEECGGLIFGSKVDEEGNLYAGASLTFDQYKTDQVVQIHYEEEGGEKLYGFSVFDRPSTPMSELIKKQRDIASADLSEEERKNEFEKLYDGHAHRAFVGKDQNGEMTIKLMDSKGKPRIRMAIDENDVPRMEFLNGEGEVIYKLPPE